MKKFVRTLFAGVALAMPLTMLAASPAAAADAGTISGNGTISPGLGATPVPQTFSFTGTATTVGDHGVLVASSCSFSGTDINGSAAEGVGNFSGNCGVVVSFSACIFVRVGPVVIALCTEGSATIGAGVCVFVPGDVNPTTRFSLTCGVGAA